MIMSTSILFIMLIINIISKLLVFIETCLYEVLSVTLYLEKTRQTMKLFGKILKWILILIVSLYLITIIAGPAVFLHIFADKKVSYDDVYSSTMWGLPEATELSLKTSDGLNIRVYEERPDSVRGVVICLSGIEKPSVTAFYGHALAFYNKGIATLLPDVRGHGESDGDKICLAYEEPKDVRAVLDYIKTVPEYKDKPVIVLGLSMGGAIAVRSIGLYDDIDALISLSAYSSIEDFFVDQISSAVPSILAKPMVPFIRLTARLKYKIDPKENSPLHDIRNLNGRPTLMYHSSEDSNVPFESFLRLSEAAAQATSNLTTVIINGDEHMICQDYGVPQNDSTYFRPLMNFIDSIIK